MNALKVAFKKIEISYSVLDFKPCFLRRKAEICGEIYCQITWPMILKQFAMIEGKTQAPLSWFQQKIKKYFRFYLGLFFLFIFYYLK